GDQWKLLLDRLCQRLAVGGFLQIVDLKPYAAEPAASGVVERTPPLPEDHAQDENQELVFWGWDPKEGAGHRSIEHGAFDWNAVRRSPRIAQYQAVMHVEV